MIILKKNGMIIKRIMGHISNSRGFSYAELLLATLIMLLATSIITATIALAMDQYRNIQKVANAETLCTMLSNYVENELSYSTIILNDTGTDVRPGSKGGEFIFNSDAHNFGAGAYFVVIDEQGKFIDYISPGEIPSRNGRLAESSIVYEDKFYNIAGEGAYKKNNASLALYSAMSINYLNDKRALSIHIWVTDKDTGGDTLVENYFLVVPFEVIEIES